MQILSNQYVMMLLKNIQYKMINIDLIRKILSGLIKPLLFSGRKDPVCSINRKKP